MSLTVRGPALSLRYATEGDAPALLELGGDPEVTRFFSWGPYTRLEQPLAFVDSLRRQREEGTRLEFVVVDGEDRPVGVTGLSEFSLRDRRAVVGTWFGRAHWGTGKNPESKALVLALAFRELNLGRVTAWANPTNGRSVAALERLGFVHEGVLRGWHVHRGRPQDVAVLRVMREEWERGPLASVPVAIEGHAPPQFVAEAPPDRHEAHRPPA
jgi:[ribosomal protein S5]-alanine N-acetyltransferase